MTTNPDGADLRACLLALEHRLGAQLDQLQTALQVLERRVDLRLTELRAKQEEDLTLVKAMSCQLRGRVGRVERRAGRTGL